MARPPMLKDSEHVYLRRIFVVKEARRSGVMEWLRNNA
jgi:hypothetical protein